MRTYVALLRGINVGGKNLVPMATLKTCFEDGGFANVATYIQSGNVLFDAAGRQSRKDLTEHIEGLFSTAFGVDLAIVVRSHREMSAMVAEAPKGFGSKPAEYRYDVVFLKEPLTSKTAMNGLNPREEVDEVWAGKGVLYFSRLTARATQSRLNKVASLPVYKSMTIRNWNTTTKILSLLDARAKSP